MGTEDHGCRHPLGRLHIPPWPERQAGNYGHLLLPFTRSNDKQIFYIGQPRFRTAFGNITLFVHLLFFYFVQFTLYQSFL